MNNLLNVSERNELERCEVVIKQGLKTFVEVGQALMLIRDKRLYRSEFGTFEDYCRQKWNMVQQSATRLIRAAETITILESEPIGSLLPQTESQARPLTKLEPELQAEAWQQVVEQHGEKVTQKKVQEVVKEFVSVNEELKQAKKEPMFAAMTEEQILAKAKEIREKSREHKKAQIKADLEKRKQESAKYTTGQILNNVILGDAKNIDYPKGISLIVTDPPYGQDFISNRRVASPKDEGIKNDNTIEAALETLDSALSNIYEKLNKDSHVFIFTGWRYEPEFRLVISNYFEIKGSLVWVKNNHGSGDLYGSFAPKHERIIDAVKGNPKLIKRIPDVIYGNDFRTNHPTKKPIDLIAELIECTTVEGELVVDMFAGEGSTVIAAKETNRNYFVSELDSYNYSQILKHLDNGK